MAAYFRIEDTDYMEGHDFEYFCADILRKNGFVDVEVTPGSGDSGADIIAKKQDITGYVTYAIQCKRYQGNVSNKAVQEAHFARSRYRCMIAAVLTNSYFTKQAQEDAQHTGVKLWDRSTLDTLIRTAYPPERYRSEDNLGNVLAPSLTNTAEIKTDISQSTKSATNKSHLFAIGGLAGSILLIAFLLCFYAHNKQISKNTPKTVTTAQTITETEAANIDEYIVYQQPTNIIEEKLMAFLDTHRDISISVFVQRYDDALEILLFAEEATLKTAFSDYANALVVKSQELATEYGFSISQISVVFMSGEDNMMTWRTTDCISGFFFDTYDGSDVWVDNQTIQDLVDRYGTMNWFYPLT